MIQATFRLNSADDFGPVCSAVWEAGGFVKPIPDNTTSIHVVMGGDVESAVRAAIAAIVKPVPVTIEPVAAESAAAEATVAQVDPLA